MCQLCVKYESRWIFHPYRDEHLNVLEILKKEILQYVHEVGLIDIIWYYTTDTFDKIQYLGCVPGCLFDKMYRSISNTILLSSHDTLFELTNDLQLQVIFEPNKLHKQIHTISNWFLLNENTVNVDGKEYRLPHLDLQ